MSVMSPCNYFVASFQWGDLTHQEAAYSMALFAREVMPHFADAAVAGTDGSSSHDSLLTQTLDLRRVIPKPL